MSFSGGVYTLPGPALVTGEIVSATENNQFRNDVAGAFNVTMLRNGTSTATANLPMGGYKLTGLGAATTSGDALSYGNAAVVTTLTSTSLTATRVPYAGTGGLLQDASTFTFDGTTLTAGGFTTSGAISAGTITASGAITVSGGTANGVAYLNGSKVLTTGSALTFDGTTLLQDASGSGSQANFRVKTNATGAVANAYFNIDGTDYFRIYTSSVDTGLRNLQNTPLYFSINNTEQMRLTSTGLGIGTSSVIQPLTLGGTGNIYAPSGATWYTGGDLYIRAGTSGFLSFGANNTNNLMRLDTSGNLGLNVTPSTWSVWGSVLQGNAYAITGYNSAGNVQTKFWLNSYRHSSGNPYYISNGAASSYSQDNGVHRWETAPSGTAGSAITFTQAMTLDASGRLGVGTTSPQNSLVVSNGGAAGIEFGPTNGDIFTYNRSTSAYTDMVFTTNQMIFRTNGSNERMRIDSSGNVGIGTTSPAYKLDVSGDIRTNAAMRVGTTGGDTIDIFQVSGGGYVSQPGNRYLAFGTNNTERMRIDSDGRLIVGTNASQAYSSQFQVLDSSATYAVSFYTSSGGLLQLWGTTTVSTGWNAGDSITYLGKCTSTSRSINAAGTINASGADYAEYMTKANDFVIAKGDICGIDKNGFLTNVFSDAISFVVKSTNPSYVGGDSWGNVDEFGMKPENPDEVDAWQEKLELARQKVDRIAFSGQVPVNVIGADAGQYIIPINDNGAIKGKAVNNPTFEQYQIAVGKVIAIESDGRARIIVKVA